MVVYEYIPWSWHNIGGGGRVRLLRISAAETGSAESPASLPPAMYEKEGRRRISALLYAKTSYTFSCVYHSRVLEVKKTCSKGVQSFAMESSLCFHKHL